ncbi:Uncharacterised protein [Bacteroides uniformis]|uniref:Uncharacterized protein n=3 Tax=Bacteroides TaxID=816 RepID=A0A174SGK3_BACT4|nr:MULTISPECIES: hypothetical protein [Bacteroidaceae]CUP52850.1 Uncharacterised protein [Bacteroides uniformis]CUP96832.1 Uncharacterised protein [Bacteroides thetaiotaomicron]CUQ32826.1 Uncharacterised protein [Parabacteroides distasonis]KAA9040423.1 hypothetical protein F6S82_19875 [Bacteroides xylanisolvens]MDB0704723.1 hypothetical protein [Bacteroides xylanisolvens]
MIKLYSLCLKLFRLLVRNDFYAKLTVRKGWIRQVNSEWNEVEYPNLRYAEGCHKYPETVNAALLDDHSKAVSLHTKSLR